MFQAVKFWWKMDTSWRRPKFFEWVVKNHHLVISTFVPSPWAWEHQTVPNRKPTNFGFLLQLGETRSECSLKQQKKRMEQVTRDTCHIFWSLGIQERCRVFFLSLSNSDWACYPYDDLDKSSRNEYWYEIPQKCDSSRILILFDRWRYITVLHDFCEWKNISNLQEPPGISKIWLLRFMDCICVFLRCRLIVLYSFSCICSPWRGGDDQVGQHHPTSPIRLVQTIYVEVLH